MRRALLATLPLLCLVLAGCPDKYDGTYLLSYTLTEDTANPDNSWIGVEQRTLGSLYRTGDAVVLKLDNALLTGNRVGDSLELGSTMGMVSNDDECVLYELLAEQVFEGRISSDLALDGVWTVRDTVRIQDCPPMDDQAESEHRKYDVVGMKLNAVPGQHAGEDSNWGYVPFGIY